MHFVASVSEQLIARPKALREALQDERAAKRVIEDPVFFFAVLMCIDK